MNPRIVIVGGGIAGLAAAHRCLELAASENLAVEVMVVEASARLGGAIATEIVGDFVVEAGPDSFLSEKPWALHLAQRLGLQARIVGTNETYRHTYVAVSGQLHPLPEGFFLLAPTRIWPFVFSRLFTWPGKLRIAADLVLPRGPQRSDESLAEFVLRRLGREALDRVAQPLIGGIYLARAETLSLRATMARFLELERQYRSLILGMRAQARHAAGRGSGARWSLFLSFDRGLQVLVDALVEALRNATLLVQTPVKRIERRARRWYVALENGQFIEADAVILAVPAQKASQIVANAAPELAWELEKIGNIPSVTVTLAYPRSAWQRPLKGFGFVIPRTEGKLTWACTLSHQKYPQRAPTDAILVRAFLGGEEHAEILGWDDSRLQRAVRLEIEPLLAIRGEPILTRVYRYPHTMPAYTVGHLERVASIEKFAKRYQGLALAGNSYWGVGIPDCVRSGERAAEEVWRWLCTAVGDSFFAAARGKNSQVTPATPSTATNRIDIRG